MNPSPPSDETAPDRSRSRQWLAPVLIFSFGAFVIFYLPWRLPPVHPVVSDSYNLGFNNQVAVLGTLVTAFILCLYLIGNPRTRWSRAGKAALDEYSRTDLIAPQPTIALPGNLLPFRWFGAVAAANCLLVLAWLTWLPFNYWGEADYFLPRIDLIHTGHVPYRDFGYAYGPLFLYLPVWLVWLTHYRMGSDLAYWAALLLVIIAGLAVLSYVVNWFNAAVRLKLWTFLLLAVAGMNLDLGEHWTLLRFVLPYGALILVHRCAQRFAPNRAPVRFLKQSAAVAAIAVLGAAISPEVGIVCCVGMLVYGIAVHRAQSRVMVALAAFAVLVGALVVVALPGYLNDVHTFLGGGFSFPVWPAPHILLYLASLLFTVPLLVAYGWRHKSPVGALCIAWAAQELAYVFPALGRCDYGHVFFNGFGAFVICFMVACRSRRTFASYGLIFSLVFILGQQFSFFLLCRPEFELASRLRGAGYHRLGRALLAPHSYLDGPPYNGLIQLLRQQVGPDGKIGLPWNSDEELELILKRGGLYAPDFVLEPNSPPQTEAGQQRKLRDTAASRWIMVPRAFIAAPRPIAEEFERSKSRLLSRVLLWPVRYKLRRRPLWLEFELRDFILRNYQTQLIIEPYWLMRRRWPAVQAR